MEIKYGSVSKRQANGTDRTFIVTFHKNFSSRKTVCCGSSHQGLWGPFGCTHAKSALCCLSGMLESFRKAHALLVFSSLPTKVFQHLAKGLKYELCPKMRIYFLYCGILDFEASLTILISISFFYSWGERKAQKRRSISLMSMSS